jgi:hypothetical protein
MGLLAHPRMMKKRFCSATSLSGSAPLPFVISTEAYPDFLLRAAGDSVPGTHLTRDLDVPLYYNYIVAVIRQMSARPAPGSI